MKILAIGTISKHKIGAAQRAVASAGLQTELQLTGAKTRSGVAEQPVGFEEIRAGALHRAFGALDEVGEAQFGLGIENGLVDIGDEAALCESAQGTPIFIDLTVVVLVERNPSKPFMLAHAIYTTSTGVPCPSKYVRLSFETDRSKTTGDFIAEDTGCDGTDWHAYFSDKRLSRNSILEQAVLAALSFKFSTTTPAVEEPDALEELVAGYKLGSWADPEEMFTELSGVADAKDHARLRELIAARAKQHNDSLE